MTVLWPVSRLAFFHPMQSQLRLVRWLAGIFALGMLVPAACFLFGFDESIHRIDTPAANPVAAGIVDPVLPASVTNIYFLDFAGSHQDLERFVGFSVPPAAIDQVVDDLISANNRKCKRSLTYPRSHLSAAIPVTPRGQFLPMNWWTPSRIKMGYNRGEPTSFSLQIWADTASGAVFVYQKN